MKVCSLLPSATEILFALGRGDDLVGVSHECHFPSEALGKPRVIKPRIDQERMSSREIDTAVRDAVANNKRLYDLDEKVLLEGEPDLIVTQKLCKVCAVDTSQVQEVIQALPKQPKVLSLHPHTLSDLLQDILLIGEAVGASQQAEVLVDRLKIRMERIRDRLKGIKRPRVFCLEWFEPLMSSGHWVPEQVELAGGHEVIGQAGSPSQRVTSDAIVKASPEVMILMPCGFSVERSRQELPVLTGQSWWDRLPAVSSKQVYVVDGPSYFNQSGPRTIEGIELLAGLIHPDLCADLVPSGSAWRLPAKASGSDPTSTKVAQP